MVGGTIAQRSATALGIRTCSFSYQILLSKSAESKLKNSVKNSKSRR